MAPVRSRPWRWLVACLAVIAALYGGVFASGHPTPKLGLDLRGGTSVILEPQLTSGQTLKSDAQNQAVDIIRQRVDGLGVSGALVQTQGNNIVIQVPGQARDQVISAVGQTAELRFRQVLAESASGPLVPQPSQTVPVPSPSGTTSPKQSGSPAATSSAATPTGKASTKAKVVPGTSGTASPHGRAIAGALLAKGVTAAGVPAAAAASPAANTPASPAADTPASTPTPAPASSAKANAGGSTAAACDPLNNDPSACLQSTITYHGKKMSVEQAFASLDCSNPANRAGGGPVDPANQPLVTCSRDGTAKYALAPAVLVGKDVSTASADPATGSTGLATGGFQVDLTLTGHGGKLFSHATRTVYQLQQPLSQIAIVLDGLVESAPVIQEPIDGGRATISGGDLSQQAQAESLANILKYGALPVSFHIQDVESVSATLGSQQLHAGLLAGAIGLGLVLLYSLLYYRGLGIVTILSLAISGVTTYATVTLLGSHADYRLSLAGIAGFIVAVGITADSFVVYFERLRDEIREGRTLRSGVERAWVRARRTIISADFVSLLAAVILYFLSVGDVRGFAFTLGLSTVTDLFIVFFFTKPLISLLSRTRLYGGGGAFSGLGRARFTPRVPAAAAAVAKEA